MGVCCLRNGESRNNRIGLFQFCRDPSWEKRTISNNVFIFINLKVALLRVHCTSIEKVNVRIFAPHIWTLPYEGNTAHTLQPTACTAHTQKYRLFENVILLEMLISELPNLRMGIFVSPCARERGRLLHLQKRSKEHSTYSIRVQLFRQGHKILSLCISHKKNLCNKKEDPVRKKPRWHPGWIARHLFLPGNNKRRCGFYDSPMRIRASSKEEEEEGTGKAPWEKNSCS